MRSRFILISLCLLFAALNLQGQQRLSLGLKAGTSLSNQKVVFTLPGGDFRIGTNIIAGPVAGIILQFSPGERWGIRADAGYLTRGSSTTTESVTVYHLENNRVVENKGDPERTVLRYISISPQIRYVILRGRTSPYLLAGPRFDLLAGMENGSGYALDEQNSFIPGLSTGAGVEFTAGGFGLFLEGLYLADALQVTGTDPVHISNRGGMLAFGIRYGW